MKYLLIDLESVDVTNGAFKHFEPTPPQGPCAHAELHGGVVRGVEPFLQLAGHQQERDPGHPPGSAARAGPPEAVAPDAGRTVRATGMQLVARLLCGSATQSHAMLLLVRAPQALLRAPLCWPCAQVLLMERRCLCSLLRLTCMLASCWQHAASRVPG